MDCLTRALCYIRRKKMKSVLLLLLFLVINCMVLGALGIRKLTLELERELRKNAGNCSGHPLSKDEIWIS